MKTLEEAFSNYVNEKYHSPTQGSTPDLESVKFGAKWQQDNTDKKYTEEDIRKVIILSCFFTALLGVILQLILN